VTPEARTPVTRSRSSHQRATTVDGPHPGLEEHVSTRQLVVQWGQRHAVLRDEKLTAALDAHAADVADPALGEAASAMLESTGEPGAGAAAAGTMMSESELQRIIDRAGLTSAPADLHPLAYVRKSADSVTHTAAAEAAIAAKSTAICHAGVPRAA